MPARVISAPFTGNGPWRCAINALCRNPFTGKLVIDSPIIRLVRIFATGNVDADYAICERMS